MTHSSPGTGTHGKAWRTTVPGSVDGTPLHLVDESHPVPAPGELLVSVQACGVCRTDLHVVEGDLPVHSPQVVPGHEIVGTVTALGVDTVTHFRVGDRVGIPWLRHTCGTCSFCAAGRENLCTTSRYTGWDHDGGFAEWVVVPADYALALPDGYSTAELAPLLCAGIIGYRALMLAELPPRGVLGLYGFGGSAHIVAQLARADGATVHVMTRDPVARDFALSLGMDSAQGTFAAPPQPLDAAIVFAPIGEIVPVALEALVPGGTVVLAGIYMTDVPALNYQRHLFHEKRLRSVEANTREDARAFLDICGRVRLQVQTTVYPFDRVPDAVRDLKHGRFPGAAVVVL
ncbi:Zinc-binding dehydrogenase [Rhodococcus sp. AW25M09]|uniref:zinc-dependent alcohol dehydrogenase family protein n=1 Tax=Rhodococcus sp. AW25M09 TaxID=1268303 RepID=UPI0002AC5B89|nr:zinc-dependent alcohol dehydrogenase family protein [Rhodococcus sp. AW25M09]CCQ13563.1 Zinc-binding dehydrogenase [Rhodococcus sp. AW25M09]